MVHYWGGVCSVWLYYGGAAFAFLNPEGVKDYRQG